MMTYFKLATVLYSLYQYFANKLCPRNNKKVAKNINIFVSVQYIFYTK